MLVQENGQCIIVVGDCGGRGLLLSKSASSSAGCAFGGLWDPKFHMTASWSDKPRLSLWDRRRPLGPEVPHDSQLVRYIEVVTPNSTHSRLTRESDDEVQRVRKAVCDHGDLLTEVNCIHSDNPGTRCPHDN